MSGWRPFEPSREAVDSAWAAVECSIVNGRCTVHDEDELSCSHRCEQSSDWEHDIECEDPPPPAVPAAYDDNCIACGRRIREGELARLYEEGYVHPDGCPERPEA